MRKVIKEKGQLKQEFIAGLPDLEGKDKRFS